MADGASDASERVKIPAFHNGLDLHVELVAYRNHARNSIPSANVLPLPASPAGSEHASRLWEASVGSSTGRGSMQSSLLRDPRRRRRQRREQSKEER